MIVAKGNEVKLLEAQISVLKELLCKHESSGTASPSAMRITANKSGGNMVALVPGSIAEKAYSFLLKEGVEHNIKEISFAIGKGTDPQSIALVTSSLLRHVKRNRFFVRTRPGVYAVRTQEEAAS